MTEKLATILAQISRPVVAVSGGVDSVTLAALAMQRNEDVLVMHAISPAVPAEATARLVRFAKARGWQLLIIGAGEFDDPNYRSNPANRCFYCKTNLYGTIRAQTDREILSGANLDDLHEYRPGLDAARLHRVRHPYIEAAIAKSGVRKIARDLGLHEFADLPASPCLSSRVETGIRIEAATLEFIDRVERMVRAEIAPATVRCRVRSTAVVIELDAHTLGELSHEDSSRLARLIGEQPNKPLQLPVLFERYRNGSAFLTERAH